ncbi:MAG TPA: carboxymuconolactone decarboxylase family protein [Terracidiphilus sp.]|nr:carboxymuconolactone decarboxylase family protein [Terracidiphilus sp.]
MSRISRLDRNEVTPDLAALFDKVYSVRGNVPNMFRVMAHRPEIFSTMQAHFDAVLNTGTVPVRLKELIIVRTSQVNETPYCLASHTILARGLGWTDDQLSHLAEWQRRDDFTPAEKAALRLAETVTRDANSVTDEQYADLRTYYSEGEIVELLCAIGLFNYFNRFNNALKMQPTKPGEGGVPHPDAPAAYAPPAEEAIATHGLK